MEEMRKTEWASCATSAPTCSGVVRRPQRRPQVEGERREGKAKGRFFVTPHAVHRYIERVHPGISYERALGEIIEAAAGAHYVKDYNSGQYWRGPKPMRLRLIVANGSGGELPQITTILPASDNMGRK